MVLENCNDVSLMNILVIVKNILTIIQIVVPILLLMFATIQFIQLVKNPEENNGIKKVIHKFLAAVIVFFIPMTVNVVMGMLGETTDISKCWNTAKSTGKASYIPSDREKEKKKFIYNAEDYEKGSSRGEYNDAVLEAVPHFAINLKQDYESNSSYTTQAAAYDGHYILVGQHRKFTVNGVRHRNEGGRVAWFDPVTAKIVAKVAVGAEGIHMDRLAYDSDRDVVLVGSNGSEKMLQISNKTKQIMSEKYTSMSGGNSRHFKYDSHNHQLLGLDGKVLNFYKYNASNNTYQKTGSIPLEVSTKWDPQNFNTDGQVIYIANSNPGWDHADYAVITFDMETGKMVEYHQIAPPANGEHIEDVVIDTEGSLWLINVTAIYKASNYVANAFPIGIGSWN